ncbi:MAG TPA: P83/100 family protein, partial [Turneriella sp.]|nr:P83/100 family protein [Turneriella sp.]
MQRVILSYALLLSSAVSALSVNEPEIKSKSGITFINSPDTSGSDSVSAIRGIGISLATEGNSGNAYRVIHATGQGGDKFDADIIVIGATAKVAHIKNIRRILSGYLQERFKYAPEEAKSLAVFITYYNGFYRKNLGYFKEHYKPEVMKHLSAANAGLDRSYKGWPGKSRIVIPLSGDSKPDAGKIGEKDVMDKVRKEEKDKGVKDREQITKLQDKEVKNKEERISKEKEGQQRRREEITKKEERLKEEKKKNEENPNPQDKAKKDD